MAESSQAADHDESRRDFLVLAAGAMGAVGAASFAWPLIDQMNPAADTLALASIEVDVSRIAEGQSITIKWRGRPIFIRHPTASESEEASGVLQDELRDPEGDDIRAQKRKDHLAKEKAKAEKLAKAKKEAALSKAKKAKEE